MTAATLTSKGQITIPASVRRLLRLHTGDLLDFVVKDDGNVLLKPGRTHAEDLKGILKGYAKHKPVSLEEMEVAIQAGYEGN